MSHETLLTIDELNRMDDITAAEQYSAEVRRIEFLTREQQAAYVTAAQAGNEDARHALIVNCLNWTLSKAAYTWLNEEPGHTDVLDLAQHANLKMLEALPRALTCENPTSYLLSVAAHEMRLYCIYEDHLVRRPNHPVKTKQFPETVSLEADSYSLLACTPGPDCSLESPEAKECLDSPEYKIVEAAMRDMSWRRRQVLSCVYGLFGNPAMRVADVALMLNVPVKIVENELYRGKKCLAKKLVPYLAELGVHAA